MGDRSAAASLALIISRGMTKEGWRHGCSEKSFFPWIIGSSWGLLGRVWPLTGWAAGRTTLDWRGLIELLRCLAPGARLARLWDNKQLSDPALIPMFSLALGSEGRYHVLEPVASHLATPVLVFGWF